MALVNAIIDLLWEGSKGSRIRPVSSADPKMDFFVSSSFAWEGDGL